MNKIKIIILIIFIMIITTIPVFSLGNKIGDLIYPIVLNDIETNIEGLNKDGYSYLKTRDISHYMGLTVCFKDDKILINDYKVLLRQKLNSVSIVEIYNDCKLITKGTCVYVGDGKILTNKHLIKSGYTKILVDGHEAKKIRESTNHDLLLLETEYKNKNYIKFKKKENKQTITISSPFGLDDQITYGNYINIGIFKPYITDIHYEINNKTANGSSGGLLMDSNFNSYGLLVGSTRKNTTLAITYETIIKFLEK